MRFVFAYTLLLACFNNAFALSKSDEVKVDSVTCKHAQLTIDTSDFSSFAIFDSIVKTKKIFFIGEDHTYRKSNSLMQMQFLRYLHQKAGVRVLMFEFGPSVGWMVNHYIQTGDSTYFQSFKNYYFLDFQELYKDLYEFNQTLDSANKISVVGIDMERSPSSAVKYLNFLLPNGKEVPKQISLNIESLKGLVAYLDKFYNNVYRTAVDSETSETPNNIYEARYFSSESTLAILVEDFEKNDSLYKVYLGKNYSEFKIVLEGVKADKKWRDFSNDNAYQEWIYREQYMFDNFEKYVKEHPTQKFIGSFGRCHTSMSEQSEWCGLHDFESLVTRINKSKNPLIENSVLSVGTYYPRTNHYHDETTLASTYMKNLVDFTKDEQIMVFEVFSDTAALNDMKKKFQYVIVNKLNPNEQTLEVDDEFEFGYGTDDFRMHLDFSYGQHYANFSGLNSSVELTNPGFSFKTPLTFYSIGTTFGDDEFAMSVMYNYFNPQNKTLMNGDNLDLTGHQWNFLFGADLFKTKYFDMYVSPGFTYGKMTLKQSTSSNTTSLFSAPMSSTFENKLVGALLQVDTRVNLGFISVGFKAGYTLDLSPLKWRNEQGDIVLSTPSTSMSGLYGAVNFSFMSRD